MQVLGVVGAVGGGGGGEGGGGGARVVVLGSNKTLVVIFWMSFLICWRKGRHVGGEGAGHGSMCAVRWQGAVRWAEGAVRALGGGVARVVVLDQQ